MSAISILTSSSAQARRGTGAWRQPVTCLVAEGTVPGHPESRCSERTMAPSR